MLDASATELRINQPQGCVKMSMTSMRFCMAPGDIVSLVEEEMMNQSSMAVAPLIEEVEMPFDPDGVDYPLN
ncbi:hypothetical protein V6N13_111965 [Hibiscus sabdariffa]|uniref:Uncharacterized protein n=1 Tax=Hibiscus sabdariffa TaxID=183260 RepID=A0ABR2TLT6_9ROSI